LNTEDEKAFPSEFSVFIYKKYTVSQTADKKVKSKAIPVTGLGGL
jgi:hypothetical protein